jgi:hypothetical protein
MMVTTFHNDMEYTSGILFIQDVVLNPGQQADSMIKDTFIMLNWIEP